MTLPKRSASANSADVKTMLKSLQQHTKDLERIMQEVVTTLEDFVARDLLGRDDRYWSECGIDFYQEIQAFEIALISRALRARGSQKDAAAFLRLNLSTLNMKIKRYKIVAPRRLDATSLPCSE